MNASCVICTDLFDELSSVSATPCGHVYHTNCLELWFDTSKTCPQCRTRTCLRNIRKLYFNCVPKSDLNSRDLENKISYLTAQLSVKDEALDAIEKEKDIIVAVLSSAGKEVCDMKDSIYKLVEEVKELRVKAKSIIKLEAKVLMLEKMNEILSNGPQIQTIYNYAQKDDVLKDNRHHSKTAKQLATNCACLKQEFLTEVKSKDKFKDLNFNSKHEIRTHKSEKLYEDAMKVRNTVSQKMKTPLEIISSIDFDENPCTSTAMKVAASKEMAKMPTSIALEKALNIRIKVSGAEYTSVSSSQNKLELKATVSTRKNRY